METGKQTACWNWEFNIEGKRNNRNWIDLFLSSGTVAPFWGISSKVFEYASMGSQFRRKSPSQKKSLPSSGVVSSKIVWLQRISEEEEIATSRGKPCLIKRDEELLYFSSVRSALFSSARSGLETC
jgi:hypothetical protein